MNTQLRFDEHVAKCWCWSKMILFRWRSCHTFLLVWNYTYIFKYIYVTNDGPIRMFGILQQIQLYILIVCVCAFFVYLHHSSCCLAYLAAFSDSYSSCIIFFARAMVLTICSLVCFVMFTCVCVFFLFSLRGWYIYIWNNDINIYNYI